LASLMIGLLYVDAKVFSFLTYLLAASAVFIAVFVLSDKSLSSTEKDRVGVIFIVSFFVIFFWSAFEQAGASLTFFAEEQTNRQLGSFRVPASFFQSLNSTFVVVFAPVFAWLWIKLGKREPSSPTKMAIGLMLLAFGYLWIAFGVKDVSANVKVSMIWLVGMYAMHTWGELCLSPIGLSLVNKLAPLKFASLLMAVWFLANAAANKLAGVLSTLYPPGVAEIKKAADNGISLEPILNGVKAPTSVELATLKELRIPYQYKSLLGFEINNLNEFFMLFVFMAGIASIILFVLTEKLQKMMHTNLD
jgi:POT family proton-dependent oligopeptide transporter